VAITKTYLGQNPDGTPHFHYDAGPDGIVVLTGKAYGPVTTSDGTVYDVSEPAIEVASEEHAREVGHHLIGMYHEEHGHPDHDPAVPFVHECTDACGALAREGRG
jgi:hypothetical protein